MLSYGSVSQTKTYDYVMRRHQQLNCQEKERRKEKMSPTIVESLLPLQNAAEAQPSFCEHSEYHMCNSDFPEHTFSTQNQVK